MAKSLVLQSLFVAGEAPYKVESAQGSLQVATESPDEDLARFAAALQCQSAPAVTQETCYHSRAPEGVRPRFLFAPFCEGAEAVGRRQEPWCHLLRVDFGPRN